MGGTTLRAFTPALVAVLGALALSGSSSANRIALGNGKMTVSPNVVSAGSTGNELTFTFTADRAALFGQTIVTFPRGWTLPQRKSASAPGYLELKPGACAPSTNIASIAGRRVTIATACGRRHGYQLLYHRATAPQISADGYIFLTQTRASGNSPRAAFRPLAHLKQPIVRVRGGPVASLFIQVTSVATAGTPFTVTVRGVDAYGNNALGYASTVALTSTDHAATLPAPYPYGPTDLGQHTFTNVTLRTLGTQQITATDSNGLVVQSGPITVSPYGG